MAFSNRFNSNVTTLDNVTKLDVDKKTPKFASSARVIKRHFPSVNSQTKSTIDRPITFAIRKDATHAARMLIREMTDELGLERAGEIRSAIKLAYGSWGEDILQVFSNHIDHTAYALSEPRGLDADLHDPKYLSELAISGAYEMTQDEGVKPLLISLDDMIPVSDNVHAQIAFSRLFNPETGKEVDYVARPGHLPMNQQLAQIIKIAKKMRRKNESAAHFGKDTPQVDTRVPIVFLEDNVRRSTMLNWLIWKLDEAGVFKHARVAGISTCFCNANEDQRTGILFEGSVVPVKQVIDFDPNLKVDVTTTRDLMFDGFVVQVGDDLGRLPGIFTNVCERFKIMPGHEEAFCTEVARVNRSFCEKIEKQFDIKLPIKWFESGTAIAQHTNMPLDTPMMDIMDKFFLSKAPKKSLAIKAKPLTP